MKEQGRREIKQGGAVRVRGTPSFFINGELIENHSLEGFEAQIDEELKKG